MSVITDREFSPTHGTATVRRRASVYHGPNHRQDELPVPSIQGRLLRSLRTRGIWPTLVSAAGAAAFVGAGESGEFELHGGTPYVCGLPEAALAAGRGDRAVVRGWRHPATGKRCAGRGKP